MNINEPKLGLPSEYFVGSRRPDPRPRREGPVLWHGRPLLPHRLSLWLERSQDPVWPSSPQVGKALWAQYTAMVCSRAYIGRLVSSDPARCARFGLTRSCACPLFAMLFGCALMMLVVYSPMAISDATSPSGDAVPHRGGIVFMAVLLRLQAGSYDWFPRGCRL
jgi:hypothetical protein